MIRQITILAPGLLGTSLALAIGKRSLAKSVVIWARRPEVRLEFMDRGWCNEVQDTPEKAVTGSQMVIICSPVETIHLLADRIGPFLDEGAIVTDVGSTKSLICRKSQASLPTGRTLCFIGSHPMAGSEKSGMYHAHPDLFKGKPCFVTPLVNSPAEKVELVIRFWREMEMEVSSISPEMHDEIVANISHLPHILASVLCSYLSNQDDSWRNLAGNGLRDTTRIASGSPFLWKAIIKENREEILRALTAYDLEIQRFTTALANDQMLEVINMLETGKRYRDRFRIEDESP